LISVWRRRKCTGSLFLSHCHHPSFA